MPEDAEIAMHSVDHLPPDIQDERRAEFAELADSLADEIVQYLHRSIVIPMNRTSG